ncbi:hypothetical protein BDR26DRAFT_854201, partial [Obelidium mucronatum]
VTKTQQLSYSQLSIYKLLEFFMQLTLASASFYLALFCVYFILRRDLPSRNLSLTIQNIFNPMTSLLTLVFISNAGFYICEALFYSGLYPRAGRGLFFFVGISQVSIAWFAWLRSKSVIALHFSTHHVKILTILLSIAPVLYTLPCIIQFLPILNSILYASIPMGIGTSIVANVDLSCLVAYTKLLLSLEESRVDMPPAYRVIAKYTAIRTIFRLLGLLFYSVSYFVKNESVAMTYFWMADAVGLLLMKIKLIQPGLFSVYGTSTKNKVKGFLAEGDDNGVTEASVASVKGLLCMFRHKKDIDN